MDRLLKLMLSMMLCLALVGTAAAASAEETDPGADLFKAIQGNQELKSCRIHMNMTMSSAIKGRPFEMVSEGITDCFSKPIKGKGEMLVTISFGEGAPQKQLIEQYFEQQGTKLMMYSLNNGQWFIQTAPLPPTVNSFEKYLKSIKKVELLSADEDTAVYAVTVDGTVISEEIERNLPPVARQGLFRNAGFFKELPDFTYILTVDKKASRISSMMMDMTDLVRLVGRKISEMPELPAEARPMMREMFADMTMKMTMTLTDFNDIPDFSIPDEALKGKVIQ